MQEDRDNQVITFGCRLNAYESQAIKEALKQSAQKNLIVFNSCAVTSEAERQLRQAVRKAKKENPQAKIIVTGCAAQINPEKYAKMGEVDLVLGNIEKSKAESYIRPTLPFSFHSSSLGQRPEDLMSLALEDKTPEILDAYGVKDDDVGVGGTSLISDTKHKDQLFLKTKESSINFLTPNETSKIRVNDIMSVRDTAPQLVSYFDNQTRAFLEIQNGCNHRCTFCIIPFGRGNSRSVAFGSIVEQVKKMVDLGHKEIVLTGVDISDYGKDLAAPITLSQMIKRLLKLVPELPRLRLSSIDVAEIDEGILELLENEPRFMPYLHLSVQSGDDMILKRMKRRHSRKQVLEFCTKARKLRPDITFGCDVIAGFPTENDEMFLNSLNLIKEAGIIFAHIFPYSKREGTPAALMPQVNGDIVKKRAALLRKAGEEELQKYLNQQVGKVLKVIVEKNGYGKSDNFLDVKLANQGKVGEIIEVKISAVENNYLV